MNFLFFASISRNLNFSAFYNSITRNEVSPTLIMTLISRFIFLYMILSVAVCLKQYTHLVHLYLPESRVFVYQHMLMPVVR